MLHVIEKPNKHSAKSPASGHGRGSSSVGQLVWTFLVAMVLIFMLFYNAFEGKNGKLLNAGLTPSVDLPPARLSGSRTLSSSGHNSEMQEPTEFRNPVDQPRD